VVSDRAGNIVWESVLPLCAGLASPLERTPDATRAALNADRIQYAVRAGAGVVLAQAAHSLQPTVTLWSRREHDLAAAMRTRHARLSAHVAQGTLFSRRNQRIAAAQSTMLAEALRRSAARLDELAAYERLSADARELIFAVIVD
jgi:hypothetical protein